MYRIVLVTDSPAKTGIAYYYFLAFKDIAGVERVLLIDEGEREFDPSLVDKLQYKYREITGVQSKEKLDHIMAFAKSDRTVVLIFNTANILADHLHVLKQQTHISLLHIITDHPYTFYEKRKQLAFATFEVYDIVCIFSNHLMPVLYQLGAKKVVRLPFAYCRYTHYIHQPIQQVELPGTVYYFGTWTPQIEKWLLKLKHFNLHIEGCFWRRCRDADLREIGTILNPHKDNMMAVMARKAAVVVNFTRANHGCFHTMKTFELTAAGACVVSNYSEEQAAFFPKGESITYFNTSNEMQDSILRLLQDESLNLTIRNQAIQSVEGHSYHDRAQQLISQMNTLFES